ncbi:MAG: shikimate dehydrogenase [Anaerolineae bacterium]|nr:shikimate dehydrogenase [Anaerolineae bacterium]
MIGGHTKLVGLMAWPIGHTLSPAMHNAAFDALGLNWRYVPLPVRPERVEAAVRGLVALGFQGCNVTVPHKQAVIPVLDSIAPDARAFGAVNTIIVERKVGGTAAVMGDNTDYKGFVASLRSEGFEPEGKRAVVVGAGGGARAVVFGLLQAGAEEILVSDLVPEQVHALVTGLADARLRELPATTEALVESARAADLLVNATPVGMMPKVDVSIWPDDVPIPSRLTVFDLVYNPVETRLLTQVKRAGARAIGGLDMLVRQGALSFEMWTRAEPPIEVMRAACEAGLRNR